VTPSRSPLFVSATSPTARTWLPNLPTETASACSRALVVLRSSRLTLSRRPNPRRTTPGSQAGVAIRVPQGDPTSGPENRRRRRPHPRQVTHAKWNGVLEVIDCVVEGDLLLTHAELRGHVELRGTTLRTLDIRYVHLRGRLTGAGLTALRGIRGLGASITGGLAIQDAVLTAPPEAESKNLAALDIYRASIGDLFLNRSTLYGGLYAIGASVTRNVRLQQAKVWSREELGLPAGGGRGRRSRPGRRSCRGKHLPLQCDRVRRARDPRVCLAQRGRQQELLGL
jgi:hypothetical protein